MKTTDPRQPLVTTERLVLYEIRHEDAPWMLRLLNEPSFLTQIGDRGVRTLEQAEGYLETRVLASYREHGFGMYRVEPLAGGEPLGVCGLVRRPGLEHTDLGFSFFPEYWGRGFATEAAAGVLAHAEHALGLHRVLAIAAPTNHASLRVLAKLGFERRGATRLPGEAIDLVLMAWQAGSG